MPVSHGLTGVDAAVVSVGALVVFALIGAALALFVLEPVPVDVTALGLLVALVLLEPYTGVTPADGVAGFSNSATITVLAMFVLSEGVRRTGAMELVTQRLIAFTEGDETRTSVALLGLAGPLSGFVNSTPVVAVLVPVAEKLARAADTSPSKLLLPLSYAAMLGSTLTLIGTSSTLLASSVAADLGVAGTPFSMFEFVQLGVVVLAVGLVYLLTVGRYLTPARVSGDDLSEEFGVAEYLTEIVVGANADAVGDTVTSVAGDRDVDVLAIRRGDRTIDERVAGRRIEAGDVLAVRAERDVVLDVLEDDALALLPEVESGDADLELPPRSDAGRDGVDGGPDDSAETAVENSTSGGSTADAAEAESTEGGGDGGTGETQLVEVVVLPRSRLTGRTISRTSLGREPDTTVLAIRRGSRLVRERMDEVRLAGGDALLVRAPTAVLDELRANPDVVVSGADLGPVYDRAKMPLAVGLLGGAVAAAGLGLAPIMVSALAAVVGMLATGVLDPQEAYDAVSWDIIFLLAGVIPLGTAMEHTGASDQVAGLVVASADLLPAIGVLAVVYVVTAILTNVVSNNASVVLMIPIAADVAARIGADPFAFVLGVTFAAATALLSPVGYQTNLMVYGPGGYTFGDFARVGAPLQALLAVVVTLGIAGFWGV